jgi:hypothetical protein
MSAASDTTTNLTNQRGDEPTALGDLSVPKKTHLIILVLCAIVVGLAMSMSIEGGEKVALPGMQSPMPELCHLKRVFHVPCPGCGLTRSFIAMGHFNLLAAAGYNVVGIPLFILTLLQVPYRAYWLTRPERRKMTLRGFRLEGALMIGVSVLLIAQWLVRLVIGQLM